MISENSTYNNKMWAAEFKVSTHSITAILCGSHITNKVGIVSAGPIAQINANAFNDCFCQLNDQDYNSLSSKINKKWFGIISVPLQGVPCETSKS